LILFTQKFILSVGARFEKGASNTSGTINYLPNERVPHQVTHQFGLLGVSFQYHLNSQHKIYGGWSQSYRPVIFSDIIPATPLDRTDPNLKNAYGYNTEIGVRGTVKDKVTYDITFFQMLYKNRIGSLVMTDDNGQNYIWKTNIGDTKTNGIELYVEYNILKTQKIKIAYFTASSFFDAVYLNGKIRDGNINKDITGNRLETVPKWVSRNGLQVAYQSWNGILQYNFVDKSFSDAFNTQIPSANGAKGLVPGYSIWDFNISYRISANYLLRFGINNFMNVQYFTKRPTGYPGQGVWSSDGRSIVASLQWFVNFF
jgi:Fe(3+) dicitrate transport protein